MNPRPNFAARRAAALLPPATSMYGPPAVAGAGVTWIRLPPWSTGSPVSSRSKSASDSSANFRAPCKVDPEMLAHSSARWPIPKAYETRPLLMMSRMLISSASRTGSQKVMRHGRQQNGQMLGAGGDGGREDVRNRQVPVVGGADARTTPR